METSGRSAPSLAGQGSSHGPQPQQSLASATRTAGAPGATLMASSGGQGSEHLLAPLDQLGWWDLGGTPAEKPPAQQPQRPSCAPAGRAGTSVFAVLPEALRALVQELPGRGLRLRFLPGPCTPVGWASLSPGRRSVSVPGRRSPSALLAGTAAYPVRVGLHRRAASWVPTWSLQKRAWALGPGQEAGFLWVSLG